jgi:hypothetical protein
MSITIQHGRLRRRQIALWRRSLYIGMAHSLLLALGQNRLRHAVQMWSNKGLIAIVLSIESYPDTGRSFRLVNDHGPAVSQREFYAHFSTSKHSALILPN